MKVNILSFLASVAAGVAVAMGMFGAATLSGVAALAAVISATAAVMMQLIEPSTLRAVLKAVKAAEPTRRRRTEPPALAEVLLGLFARGARRDAIVGDAEEQFCANSRRFGRRRARRLYRIEVARSLAPMLWAAVKRIGLIAILLHAVRRIIG